MSQWNPGSDAGGDNDALILTMIGMAFLTFVVVPALPGILTDVNGWLLAHHILVPPADALVPIPGTTGGVDARRLAIAGFLLLGSVLVIKGRKGTHGQA